MKRFFSFLLVLALLISCISMEAFALDYHPIQNDEATFETLEEARINGPISEKALPGNERRTYVSHPALDCINPGTVFIYRSANMYGTRAAARLNTNIMVYTGESFEEKDAAYAYLQELGLIDIIDEAIGSIILVTPNTAKGKPSMPAFSIGMADVSGMNGGYSLKDMQNYYALQTAMFSQGAMVATESGNATVADAEYFGGYGYLYVIGIDDGATFLSNYILDVLDYSSRMAGLLLINGTMEMIRKPATFIPTYLVNPTAAMVDKFQAANGTDASVITRATETYYNQAFPLRKVIIAKEEKTYAEYIHDAYYNMFINAMRLPVIRAGMFSAGTPYNGYTGDQAPYSLCERNAVIDGKTADGIYVIEHQEDRFADIHEENGEYLQTWYEYLPEEVLNNTAPEHSIPLILCLHGSSDDPRLFVDEQGYLTLCGKERIAAVSPEHQYISTVRPDAFKALIEYMLETYPALDPTHVYATGYSMGASATFGLAAQYPALFAAIVPMCMTCSALTDEQLAVFETLDLPMLFTTSTYGGDLTGLFDPMKEVIGNAAINNVNIYLRLNEIDFQITDLDYEAYPISGFDADSLTTEMLNGEYIHRTWMFEKDGVPMVGIGVTNDLVHTLYPEYANVMWNFAKHYSRNLETNETIYNAYVD